ncbi:putative Zinc transporter 9-like protein [Naja naja]|nr:putative Zinc transporter 9-like protein [Naja naja]
MLPALAAQRKGWRCLDPLRLLLLVRRRGGGSRCPLVCPGWQVPIKPGRPLAILPGSSLPHPASQVRAYSSNDQKNSTRTQDASSSALEGTAQKTASARDAINQIPFPQQPIQVKGFTTSDLDQLRKIKRRSPHDDTEAFTVFLRSEVEAKSIEVWGSPEALARERKRRIEAEREYMEKLFRSQKLLREYRNFQGETKPRSRASAMFLSGPGKVVMVAICINGLNFFFKLLAWVYTGSASMFSEAIHSLADTCNQALLALGISQSVRIPDQSHPYGFTNMRYIASLISGVGIFMMGAGLSWYHGIIGLLNPQPIESLLWAYCILAGSLVSEGVIQACDPSTNVVLLEDTAAVLGVMLAATCMGLTSLTGNPYYDSLGSLGVGTLLGVVSAFLIYTNTEALLGRSIQPDRLQKLTELLECDPAVRAIHDVKATDMGMNKVRFKAEVDFDGRVVTRSYLEKQDIEQLLQAFMLKHGENIIDTLGAEVDRLEKDLKKLNPEVRHVDLEIL